MYKIIVEEKSKKVLEKFIDSYKNIFRDRFFDSGIEDEDILIGFYIQKGDLIREEIYAEIKFQLSGEEIFGYKILNGNKSIKIFLKSFMLEVFFEEDLENKIRFIEDIKINKK